ncbi:unnamed protein product [Polarella glacialis]|uniref:Cytochrome b5 heme-binding domain-containing protein n=1 Tax=Polarella glacialis TaxID=89957 RepID=A0A813FWB7_POLGL|nr:unnamed protein product [Polarella glacialis]
MKVVSQAELEQHGTSGDTWIAVHGLVYDVSKFIPEHPGGGQVVQDCGGKDASEEFEDALHSTGARMEKSIILKGVLEGWEQKVESYRKLGWSESQGVPDPDHLKEKSSGFPVMAVGLAAGAVGAVALAFLMARSRGKQ